VFWFLSTIPHLCRPDLSIIFFLNFRSETLEKSFDKHKVIISATILEEKKPKSNAEALAFMSTKLTF
jgi:hypothetical protein